MDQSLVIVRVFGREVNVGKLFRACLIFSFAIHFIFFSVYLIKTYVHFGDEYISSAYDLEPVEIDMDIPPELIGGSTTPAPVEKQEWVEGKNKFGDDPELDDTNTNKISGDGTDPDGYLFSFNGDKPPTAIIDFDLKRYYPAAARSANVLEYTVTVLVQVSEAGKLVSAKIVSGQAMYGFNEAALKVVNRARFYPGYKSGKPVKMAHHMAIRFTLEN